MGKFIAWMGYLGGVSVHSCLFFFSLFIYTQWRVLLRDDLTTRGRQMKCMIMMKMKMTYCGCVWPSPPIHTHMSSYISVPGVCVREKGTPRKHVSKKKVVRRSKVAW